MQLPPSLTYGLQMNPQVIEVRLVGIGLVEFATEKMSNVFAVDDAVGRCLGTCKSSKKLA